MDSNEQNKTRNIIPRWRDFQTTLALGELEPAGQRVPKPQHIGNIEKQLADWKENKTLSFATDLIGAAISLGITTDIDEAAHFILSGKSRATELQRRLASIALRGPQGDPAALPTEGQPNSEEIINRSKEKVRQYRADLRRTYRNPITLVELSREFATLGALDKALKTMDVAVSLGGANRFVIRSATQLYVHANKLEKAHWVLRKAPSLRSDPWLLAAEIAVASMRDLTSRHIKKGEEHLVSNDFDPFELSELFSAIGTEDFKNANSKRARKFFRKALVRPNDNSAAQVEWAAQKLQNFDVDVRSLPIPFNFEAPANEFYYAGKLTEALQLGRQWILDQPFSPSPVLFTGMVANLLEDYPAARMYFEFGLSANPEHAVLRNNMAFAYASENRTLEAQAELDRIDKSKLRVDERIVVTATQGLIHFRNGQIEEGRQFYTQALELARSESEPSYVLRALLFLAREEVYAKTNKAREALSKAEDEARKYRPHPEFITILERLNEQLSVAKA